MKIILSAFVVVLAFLSGCVASFPPSINEEPLVRLASIDAAGLFAADSTGSKVALVKDGLTLFEMESATAQKISPDEPIALAWSPDGRTLSAAFPSADYETRLLLFSTEGGVRRDLLLPVALTQLVWSARGDLLVAGLALDTFSFGGNLRQSLYLITEGGIQETVLADTTLRPFLVARLKGQQSHLLPVSFSPEGDELVFVDLHDPPALTPYIEVVYFNWQLDGKRVLDRFPLQPVSFHWDASGDSLDVLVGEEYRSIELWANDVDALALSAADDFRFADSCLYKGTELQADWGPGARLQCLADGRFLLAVQKSLYLGQGLQTVAKKEFSENHWNLRRWRFEGLITPGEYRANLEENIK